jgi:aminoglycoside phosphotransferase (APT) family kinase protein
VSHAPERAVDPFEMPALERWLEGAGLGTGPVALHQIGGGLSNLTFAATTSRGTFVLRRSPPPPLPRGANDMRREATILEALAASDVPVPDVLAFADAGEVAEVPCYAMEHLTGAVPGDALPTALDDPAGRRSTAEAFIDVLAAIHRVDWRGRGLDAIGRPDGYLRRRLERLPRLIAADDGSLPGAFAALRDDLATTLPHSGPASLLHGDYRLGNVMLAPEPPARIIGVLDWELAGIGDPVADLGYTLATYAVPGEPLHALTELSRLTLADGFPSRKALAARYARATGADLRRLSWYEAAALFSLAVLYEYNRRKADDAAGLAYYADLAHVPGLLDAARRALREDGRGSSR